MADYLKGGVLMGAFLAQALGVLFKENEALLNHAKTLGGVVACRVHRQQEMRDCMTGAKRFVWQVEFLNEEDLATFDAAVRGIVDATTGEER